MRAKRGFNVFVICLPTLTRFGTPRFVVVSRVVISNLLLVFLDYRRNICRRLDGPLSKLLM